MQVHVDGGKFGHGCFEPFCRQKDHDGRHRQQEDDDLRCRGLIEMEDGPGTQHRADHRKGQTDQRNLPDHLPAAHEIHQRRHRAEHACEFVCAQGQLRRDSGHKQGRHQNEPSAAGDGIDKSGQKGHGGKQENDAQAHSVSQALSTLSAGISTKDGRGGDDWPSILAGKRTSTDDCVPVPV